MSRSRKDAIETEQMLERLVRVLYAHRDLSKCNGDNLRADAESLRRISMTLHRWHELECGTDHGCIERGDYDPRGLRGPAGFTSDDNGRPYWANHGGARTHYTKMPDREKGALARLAKIMARYPSLQAYIQGDPRGCALYILRPGDVPAGEKADSYYSRGIAVHA